MLIPHNQEPIPLDGRRPRSDRHHDCAGVYNLGYLSLAPETTRPPAHGWGERLVKDCRVDPVWGYFVDQRWFDLVPGFLSQFAIVREPEYNVAYWNLDSRRLERNGHGYLVDGRPLAFFHFSGFDPRHPLVLSRHQNRIDVAENAALQQVLAEYAHRGHRRRSRHRPGLGLQLRHPRGRTPVDEAVRILYDDFAAEHGDAAPRLPRTAPRNSLAGEQAARPRGPVARRAPDEAPLLEEPWGMNGLDSFAPSWYRGGRTSHRQRTRGTGRAGAGVHGRRFGSTARATPTGR